jgi:hypothetical protein
LCSHCLCAIPGRAKLGGANRLTHLPLRNLPMFVGTPPGSALEGSVHKPSHAGTGPPRLCRDRGARWSQDQGSPACGLQLCLGRPLQAERSDRSSPVCRSEYDTSRATERLLFPAEFVGRGDMSRGGLMLRCVDQRTELSYVPVQGAMRRGARPPKLPPDAPPRHSQGPPEGRASTASPAACQRCRCVACGDSTNTAGPRPDLFSSAPAVLSWDRVRTRHSSQPSSISSGCAS